MRRYGWDDTLVVGTDGAQDLLSDDPAANPAFYSWNHVFMPYCTGDTWSGTRTADAPAPGASRFVFAGHHNVRAAVAHLNATAPDDNAAAPTLAGASHVLLSGASAGGIGTFQNADAARDSLFPRGALVKAAPVSGGYFPGPVVEFVEYVVGVTAPLNALASRWLTGWFGSALNANCVAAFVAAGAPDDAHRCWDAGVLYEHIAAPLFVIQNRFDQNQINDVLLCPTDRNTSRTVGFVESFGATMRDGLYASVRGARGAAKGDGLFAPSCFTHTSNMCMSGGPTAAGVRLRDVLPAWVARDDTSADGDTHMFIDACNDADRVDGPCNAHCEC